MRHPLWSPRCPPREFIPALCNVIIGEDVPTNVMEAAMRAMTFYLDVSADCARRIVGVEGTVAAICNRLQTANLLVQETRDLAMQCVKVGGGLRTEGVDTRRQTPPPPKKKKVPTALDWPCRALTSAL